MIRLNVISLICLFLFSCRTLTSNEQGLEKKITIARLVPDPVKVERPEGNTDPFFEGVAYLYKLSEERVEVPNRLNPKSFVFSEPGPAPSLGAKEIYFALLEGEEIISVIGYEVTNLATGLIGVFQHKQINEHLEINAGRYVEEPEWNKFLQINSRENR